MARPRKYPGELRVRAVRLVFESGRPIAHVARDLGMYKEALRAWVRQARADRGERRDLLTSEEAQRLKELERENRELRRVNEILKVASAFFATELDQTRRRWRASSRRSVTVSGSSRSGGSWRCRWRPTTRTRPDPRAAAGLPTRS